MKSRPLVFDKKLVFIIGFTILQFFHHADTLQPDHDPGVQSMVISHTRHKRSWLPSWKMSQLPAIGFSINVNRLLPPCIVRKIGTRPANNRSIEPEVSYIDPDTPITAKNRQTVVQMKLRLSSVLRDNIVNVFGYMLNRPSILNHMDLQLYASLVDILNGFRMRRIRTPELLYKLPTLAYETPVNQFKMLFQTINVTKPPQYLTGAVNVWLAALNNNQVNIDEVIRPDGGALAVDFLADIDHSLLEFLKYPSKFTPESEQAAPKYVSRIMGPVFGNIMGALIVGSLELTQPLAALIMLHTQLYKFIPEVDEAQRYLADIFYEKRPELEFVVQGLTDADKLDHYNLIRIILTRLSTARGTVDPYVQECAETILPHFLPVSTITFNPNLGAMAPIVSNPEINFELLFQNIAPGEYPNDIVRAKDSLVMAMWKKELDMQSILKGFVKHDYLSPNELMIAILDRIRRREFPPPYLKPVISALITHLKLKYTAETLSGKPMQTFMDVEMVFSSFFTSETVEEMKESIMNVLHDLKQEDIDWKLTFEMFPPSRNSRPRMLAKNILSLLAEGQRLRSPTLKTNILKLLDMLDENADPSSCPTGSGSTGQSGRKPSRPSPSAPTPPPPPQATSSQDQSTELDIPSIMQAIPIKNGKDKENVKVIREYIEEKRGTVLTGFDGRQYKTIGSFLKAIFTVLLADPSVMNNMRIHGLLKEYLPKIALDGIGANSITYIKTVTTSTVDMNSVIQAFDRQRINSNTELLSSFNVFYNFLANEFRSDVHLGSFQFMQFKTTGEFLSAFCNHLKSLVIIKQSVKNAISELEPCIMFTGLGAVKIELGGSNDTFS